MQSAANEIRPATTMSLLAVPCNLSPVPRSSVGPRAADRGIALALAAALADHGVLAVRALLAGRVDLALPVLRHAGHLLPVAAGALVRLFQAGRGKGGAAAGRVLEAGLGV